LILFKPGALADPRQGIEPPGFRLGGEELSEVGGEFHRATP
jgi:hypothetical protein